MAIEGPKWIQNVIQNTSKFHLKIDKFCAPILAQMLMQFGYHSGTIFHPKS